MSIPYSKIVAITGKVQTAAFSTEKKHMLLAMVNDLIPTSEKFIDFYSSTEFKNYFGSNIVEYNQVVKYFSYLSKTGTAPEKLVVARWYKENTAPFYKGIKITETIANLKLITEGSFKISLTTSVFEVVLNLSSITSYSDIATLIQEALNANTDGGDEFTNATCSYNTLTGGFIITSGSVGKNYTCESITEGETGIDLSILLGLSSASLSQGVDAETYTLFCDRIYNANSSGYSITTIETLSIDEITSAVEWLQTINDGQTYFTQVRLVFNIESLVTAKTLQTDLIEKDYTGYVVCFDPYKEYINILDCSICATIDFNVLNGTINFNFQLANGYTSLTEYGTVVDYQSGFINSYIFDELNSYKLNYVYSVGFGTNKTLYYGTGLVAGSFNTEDIQVNESWLEQDIQVNVMNAFNTLNKIKLRGNDAITLMNTLIDPSFKKGKDNGTIAQNATLSDAEKLSIYQATGISSAGDEVESNGYYFIVNALNDEDISKKRVRITSCYVAGGVINYVRMINNIYGA